MIDCGGTVEAIAELRRSGEVSSVGRPEHRHDQIGPVGRSPSTQRQPEIQRLLRHTYGRRHIEHAEHADRGVERKPDHRPPGDVGTRLEQSVAGVAELRQVREEVGDPILDEVRRDELVAADQRQEEILSNWALKL